MQLSNDEIRKILPHRYPFLMIDKVTDYEQGKWAKAVKCVSANEMQFLGHFPQMSVFPGVLIIEALAQTGAIALLTEPENHGKIAMFGGIKNARFRRQVVPGDVIDLECVMVRRRGNMGIGEAKATVDGQLACSAEFTFAVIDENQKAEDNNAGE